jgi:hypothetical protein
MSSVLGDPRPLNLERISNCGQANGLTLGNTAHDASDNAGFRSACTDFARVPPDARCLARRSAVPELGAVALRHLRPTGTLSGPPSTVVPGTRQLWGLPAPRAGQCRCAR